MFILIFGVAFGFKKGAITIYNDTWLYDSKINLFTSLRELPLKYSLLNLYHNYAFTVITSRLTSYMLISFWLFFFFFGESFLMITFNYTTVVDTVTSSAFLLLKQHIIFYITTISNYLHTSLSFFIYFLTSCSFSFLFHLNYKAKYNIFKLTSVYYSLKIFVIILFLQPLVH